MEYSMSKQVSYFFGLVSTVLFMALATLVKFNYKNSPMLVLDSGIQHFAESLKNNALLVTISTGIAHLLSKTSGIILLLIIILALLFLFKDGAGAVWIGFLSVTSTLFNMGIKIFIERVRPEHFRISGFENEPEFSFASGHSLYATVLLISLFLIISQRMITFSAKFWIGVLVAFLILLTMFSRIFLGVHYPSDTLGGLLEGIAFVAFTYPTYLKYKKARQY